MLKKFKNKKKREGLISLSGFCDAPEVPYHRFP